MHKNCQSIHGIKAFVDFSCIQRWAWSEWYNNVQFGMVVIHATLGHNHWITFLHFPCTHASKERCRKHSGYLGCTLLRPFSFLRLHLVTLLCSWLILKLQERDKWVVGACGDILYQLPISLCLCVISIAQLLYHWRSVFVFLVFVFLFILILQGTSSVSAQLLNR